MSPVLCVIHLGRVCALQRHRARSCGCDELPLDRSDVISVHSCTVVSLLLTIKCGLTVY